MYILLITVVPVFLIGLAAHFISRAFYRRLLRSGNSRAMTFRVITFILSFLVILFIVFYLIVTNVRFER